MRGIILEFTTACQGKEVCHGKIGPGKIGPAGPVLEAISGPAGPNLVDQNWSGRTDFGIQNWSGLTNSGPATGLLSI